MTLTSKQPPTPRYGAYDWTLFRDACMQEPGEWFCEDDPDRPKVNAHQIRRGTPLVFEPAGAFDAVYRKDGTYIRYVGVPITPWPAWDERAFHDVERTYDPGFFPAGTPDAIVDLAEAHTPLRLRALAPFVLPSEARGQRLSSS